ncbi:hypothetical protein GGR55DRAFT_77629 [Xylaria sp. FL0064]|nr:hypothetical protein GGR55DRAFT_77629 [Xylaria sp. FL0064]
MAPRKISKFASPSGLRTTPPATHTSSYMAVQEPSPPVSSPISSQSLSPSLSQPSSSQQSQELPDNMAPSRSGLSRSGTTRRHTVNQAQETPDETESTSSETLFLSEERNTQPNASHSQRTPPTQKAITQQTVKLNNALIKNKSLLYKCISEGKNEEDEDCKALMRSISTRVDDPRFKTWRQVKLWTMKNYRKYQWDSKSLRTAPITRKTQEDSSSIKTAFKKHVTPIISVAEMNMNAKRFLDSVVESLGTRKLVRAFQHRLRSNELPEDMGPLILSPLYLKWCEKQIRKVAAARNRNRYGSEDSDDDEWSDWEENIEMLPDDNSNGDDHGHVLPSIEEHSTNIEESDPVEMMPVTMQRIDRLSTPTKTPEQENRESQTGMSRQSERKKWRNSWKARKERRRRSRHRLLTSSSTRDGIDEPAHRPVPDRNQAHDRVPESPRARNETLLLPLAVCIRPFANLLSPAATATPGPDIESLFRGIGRNLGIDSVSKGTNHPDRSNPTPKKRKRPQKQTEGKGPSRDPSIRNTRDEPQHISQRKRRGSSVDSPSSKRRTPKLLIAENERVNRRLAKPLTAQQIPSRAPPARNLSPAVQTRQVHKEIQPRAFYDRSARDSTMTSRGYPEQPVSNTSQYNLPSEQSRGAEGGGPDASSKANKPERSNTAMPNRQRSSAQHIYLSDYDRHSSLPPVEDIHEELQRKGLPLPRGARTWKTTAQTNTDTQRHQTAGRKGNNNKKRHRRGPSSGNDPTSAFSASSVSGSPSKRMRFTAETNYNRNKGAVHTNPQSGNKNYRNRGNSAFNGGNRYSPYPNARADRAVPADYTHPNTRGESVPTQGKRKRARSQKAAWRMSS